MPTCRRAAAGEPASHCNCIDGQALWRPSGAKIHPGANLPDF